LFFGRDDVAKTTKGALAGLFISANRREFSSFDLLKEVSANLLLAAFAVA
jgi:hypothetical protein